MRSTRIYLTLLVGLLLAACGDFPTSPPPLENIEGGNYYQGAGCVTDGVCILPPITVTPGDGCDPWLSLSWCSGGGGPCAADGEGGRHTVGADNCTPVGGPGEGGPGSPPPPLVGGPMCPDWDPYCAPLGEPQICDPSVDPDCDKPLTKADSVSIAMALAQYLRDFSTISDSTARAACQGMLDKFNEVHTEGKVFRGAYNNPPDDGHYGMYHRITGHIHFDPWLLDAAAAGNVVALRELANTALHEGAHAAGSRHGSPTIVDGHDHFAETPFNYLSPGENSCIRY